MQDETKITFDKLFLFDNESTDLQTEQSKVTFIHVADYSSRDFTVGLFRGQPCSFQLDAQFVGCLRNILSFQEN